MERLVKYFLVLLFTASICSGCKSLPQPRYKDAAYFYQRLEADGFIEVTVCNLRTGKTSVKIISYDAYSRD